MVHPFVVIEGIDGVGKSTIARALAEHIHGKYIETPWPPFDRIRDEVDDLKDLDVRFYFYVSAVIGVTPIIRECTKHQPVVCSRYIYSTLAYHRAMGVCVDYLDLSKLPLVEPTCAFLLVATEGIRSERLVRRGAVSIWDRKIGEDEKYRLRVQEGFQSFGLLKVDTSGKTVAEVVGELAHHIFAVHI